MESLLKYIRDQISYYEKYEIDLEKERTELKHKLDLAQQRYEIYYEKLEDYKSILKIIESEVK